MAISKSQVALRDVRIPPQDKERVLALRAILGSDDLASEAAAENGIIVTPHTISNWRRADPVGYGQLQEARMGTIRQEVIAASRTLLQKRDKLANKAIDKLEEAMDGEELTSKEVNTLLRTLDGGRHIDAENIRKLSASEVAVGERASYQELVLKLARSGAVTIESEEFTVTEDEDPSGN